MAKSVAWVSPILSPSSCIPEGTSKSDAVSVPFTGWYGFCFENNDKDTNHEYIAILSQPPSYITRLNLPFVSENGSTKPLNSIHMGKLIYLPRDAIVSVVYTEKKSTAHSQPDEGKDPTVGVEPSQAYAKWRLLLQWRIFPSQDGHEEEIVALGTVSDRKKSLVCGVCARLMATRESMNCHLRDAHKILYVRDDLPCSQTPLRVVFQDSCMAVVEKPQGVDFAALCKSDLLLPLAVGKDEEGMAKPIPVHRLDAPTGGLQVIAKTKRAESLLKQQFANHGVCRKRYRAIVFGLLQNNGVCNLPVGGKAAETGYQVVSYSRSYSRCGPQWITLVDLFPKTGRKHQIRKHLKSLGHPIWGDATYGPYHRNNSKTLAEQDTTLYQLSDKVHSRMCLWAIELTLPHPFTKVDLHLQMDDPEWIQFVLQHEQTKWESNTPVN